MAPPCLKLCLLGAFAIEVDGQPVAPPRWRKSRWLLALLAVRQGRDVSRVWLAETLWPDAEPAAALYNLRHTLFRDLRPCLGAASRMIRASTPSTLSLDMNGVWCDVSVFDADISRAPEEAVCVYNGPFLEGCAEEWAIQERLIREEAFLSALEALAKLAMERMEFAEAARFLRRCIAASPLHETAHVALMKALAAGGDQAGVTQAYRDLRTVLRSELNAEPDEQTRLLYDRLRQEAHQHLLPPLCESKTSAAAIARRLPVPLTRLIGREREIEDIRERFTQGRLVTLLGVGGVGKTRLSIAVAEALAKGCPDGVWFVDLAPVENPMLVDAAVAAVFQVEEQPGQTIEESLMGSLESRSLLLILDNCEHLLDACARFSAVLLSRCPTLLLLATSRQALGINGEWSYRVPCLETPRLPPNQPASEPDKAGSAMLLEYDAVRLFVERAAAQRERFKPTAVQIVAIAEICDLLDGIPLAIEMAAARVHSLSIEEIRARLADRFGLLKSGSRTALPRHQTLRALIEWSYRLLNDKEKLLLARLSIFSGGCTLEAAEAVCSDASSLLPSGVLDLLSSLSEKSLVVFEESTVYCETRYRLLVTIREYAHEQLSDNERAELERIHADYYYAEALRVESDVFANETYGPHQRRMQPDSENYRAALHTWSSIDGDAELRMLLALDTCSICQLDVQQHDEWIARLESQAMPAASPLQAKLYFRVATRARYRWLPVWEVLMERAYVLAEACGDRFIMADACICFGEDALERGNLGQARDRLVAASDHAASVGAPAQVAGIQSVLISLECAEGNYTRAQQMAETLVQTGKSTNHWSTTAHGFYALADIAAHHKDYPRARDCFEKAMAVYPPAASVSRTNALRALSRMARLQGDYPAARGYLAQSLAVCNESDDIWHEAATYLGYAALERQQGDQIAAMEYAKSALRVFDLIGGAWGMATGLREMALLAANLPEEACFLWSAYELVMPESGRPIPAGVLEEIAAARAAIQTMLPGETITGIEQRCASMTWREAVRYAYREGL